MSTQLYPEVIDKSSVGAMFSQPLFLVVGVEGQADPAGTANVGQVYTVYRPSDSDTLFGPSSSLGSLVKFLLGRGLNPVLATASVLSSSSPTLQQRQAAWQNLESNKLTRIRMTDDTTQATIAALAASCDYAGLVNNKQIAFGALPAGTTKAALISAAEAINHKRCILVGPGILNSNGALLSGLYAAAAAAAEVSKNPDITDDMDLMVIPGFTGIELGATGSPLFMERVVSGVAQNDFEDLLQAGVSPLKTIDSGGGIQFTHLRMTWTTDSTFDALTTRLIVDQVFLDVRDYVLNNKFLRRVNNAATRADLRAGIASILQQRSNWIAPIVQPDGTMGYGVAVIPSNDLRSIEVQYSGIVQRNVQTVQINASLSVPV